MTVEMPNGVKISGTAEELKDYLPPVPKVNWDGTEMITSSSSHASGIDFSKCRNNPATCRFKKNGYCTASVLLSSPGMYKRCDYNPGGPMYAFCDDVDRASERKEK